MLGIKLKKNFCIRFPTYELLWLIYFMTRKEAQINYLIRQYDSAMLFTDRDAKLVLLELLSWALRNLSASPIACWPMLLVFWVRCASPGYLLLSLRDGTCSRVPWATHSKHYPSPPILIVWLPSSFATYKGDIKSIHLLIGNGPAKPIFHVP